MLRPWTPRGKPVIANSGQWLTRLASRVPGLRGWSPGFAKGPGASRVSRLGRTTHGRGTERQQAAGVPGPRSPGACQPAAMRARACSWVARKSASDAALRSAVWARIASLASASVPSSSIEIQP